MNIDGAKDVLSTRTFKKVPWLYRWLLLVLGFAAIFGGRWLYQEWQLERDFTASTQEYRDMYRDTQTYLQEGERLQQQYAQMQQADTHGGATPEETLALFVEALKAGDYKLAAKYYTVDTQEQAEIDMKDWMENYADGLEKFLNVYKKGIFKKEDGVVGVHFRLFDSLDDKYGYRIEMQINELNNIWKISDF